MTHNDHDALHRPEPWENPDPERFHFEAVAVDPDGYLGWRFRETPDRRCRWSDQGKRCENVATVELNRGPAWWAYCDQHMYGRWVEGGQIMKWKLVHNEDGRAG